MSFFNEFSLRWYDFKSYSNDKVQLITNIFHNISVSSVDIDSSTESYYIKDSDNLYSISNNKYKHPDYWWIIAILNNQFLSNSQWPLTQSQFEVWIDEKYIDIEPREVIKTYEKPNGSCTTIESIRYFYDLGESWTDLEVIQKFNLLAISIYEWESRENEKRRYIRIPNVDDVQEIDRNFKTQMLKLAKSYS